MGSRTVSIVEVHWFFAPGAVPPTSSVLLEAAQRSMPGLIPTRFGAADPPPHQVKGDLTEFEEYWSERAAEEWGASAQWIGSSGVYHAVMRFPDRRATPGAPDSGHLQVEIDLGGVASDPDRLVDVLVAVAEAGSAIYACAYVLRGWTMSGSTLMMNVFTSEQAPVPGLRWVGIPAGAAWLSWYGAAYSEVLRGLIMPPAIPTETGLLVRSAREPQTMDEALLSLPALPEELLAQRKDPRFFATTPAERAAFIPDF
jgi:hypothetical protein